MEFPTDINTWDVLQGSMDEYKHFIKERGERLSSSFHEGQPLLPNDIAYIQCQPEIGYLVSAIRFLTGEIKSKN